MNTEHSHHFVIELRKRDGNTLGQVPAAADWEPALEAVRFQALRQFPAAAVGPETVVRMNPVWHEDFREPYVSAVEMVLTVPGCGDVSFRVPSAYFKSLATAASAPLVEKGMLQSGEAFNYLVVAFPNPPPSRRPARPRARLEVEDATPPLPIKDSELSKFIAHSAAASEQNTTDIAVFIPQNVLDEADQLTRHAGEVETAAILIGHLHRDRAGGELFLEVTAQIPTINPQATATKVAFGPETWDAVHSALALRRGQEQWVGWFHSHPAKFWCNPKCSAESRAQCSLQRSFFSADDCDVHRTVFSKAFHIALLVTNTDAGLQHALFSWRNGVIVQRGFHVLGATHEVNPAVAPAALATIGDSEDEKACR